MSKYMQVLLLTDVDGQGRMGDVIKARRGFARNYLLPKKKGCLATSATLARREKLTQMRAELAQKERTESEQMANSIQGKLFSIKARIDEMGHLYGSVTVTDVHSILKESGFEVEKKTIQLSHPIKSVGLYTIDLHFKEDVVCSFDLEVRGDREDLPEELMGHDHHEGEHHN